MTLQSVKVICFGKTFPTTEIQEKLRAEKYQIELLKVDTLNLDAIVKDKPNLLLISETIEPEVLQKFVKQFCDHGLFCGIVLIADQLTVKETVRYFRLGTKNIVFRNNLDEIVEVVRQAIADSERQHATLRKSVRTSQLEELWRKGYEAGGIAIWKWDSVRDVLESSDNFGPLLGLPRGELTNCGLASLERYAYHIHPGDLNSLLKLIRSCLERKESFHTEVRTIHPDNSMHWIMVRGDVWQNTLGQVSGMNGIASDIDERKRTQQALYDSEERFRNFMNNSPCVAFVKSRDGRYVYVNQMFSDVVHPSVDTIDRNDDELFPAEIAKTLRERDLVIWDSGETWSGIEHAPDTGGVTRHWWVVKFLFHSTTGEEFLGGWAADISERLKSEDKARSLHDELIHASRLATIGQLVSELTHELNQPLYAIGNFAEASYNVLKDPDFSREDISEWLQQIQMQVKRMNDIIRRSGSFAKSSIELEHCQLNSMLVECYNLLAIRFRKEPARVEFDLADELPMIFGQPVQLQQVFVNLLSNALEALHNVPSDKREIIIRTSQVSDDRVQVEFADNGPGIAPNVLQRIFEPFFSTKKHGMGLGLSISKTIIESHGGELYAYPNTPHGVVFRIQLPIDVKAVNYATT